MRRLSLLLLLLVPHGSCSREERPPNVLLISIDTLRRDALGCYGARSDISPNLDALAARSIVFEQAVSQAPWTLPSHAALFTSLYPSQLDLGVFGAPTPISPAAKRIAELVRDARYQTFAITAGAFLVPELGFAQGFDSFDPRGGNMRKTVDTFTQRLDGLDRDRPFFAFLHTYDVHKYDPSPEDRARFETVKSSRFTALPPKAVAETLQSNDKLEWVKACDDVDRRHAREIYDAAVHGVDREIGLVLAALEERGLAADTIVVVTSDHGEEFWEHGRTGHGYNLHDENLRVPLIWFDPAAEPRRVETQVRLIDVAPTIAARLAIPTPGEWQGVDLAPAMRGADLRLPAFSEAAHLPFKSLRSPERKFILSLRRPLRTRFDLTSDPLETTDRFEEANELDRALLGAMTRFVIDCAKETRFRGATAIELDAATSQQLRELGYTSQGEAVPSEAAPWLKALSGKHPSEK